MHGKSRFAAMLAAAIVGLAFLAAIPTARADMSRPTWTAGDFWVYALAAGSGSARYNGTLRFDVKGTESINVNGTSYPTYHVAAVVNIPFGNFAFTLPADIWYNVTNLAIVKITATISIAILNFTANTMVTIAGNPPQNILWPLTAGATWSSSTTVWETTVSSNGTTRSTSVPLTTAFTVQSDTTITVPAGTFTTTPVKEVQAGASGSVVNYWAPQAGNKAKTESYNSSGASQGSYNLTAYNYQAGSFLTAVYFGLTGLVWLIILAVVIIAIAAVVLMRRRRPRAPMTMPPQQPPMEPYQPPTGPPGP